VNCEMKLSVRGNRAGIALVVVMIAITVLSVMAAAFAFSMKVETKLAQNANSETDLIWLGRSGVELARYVLAQQMTIPNEPYDALNQKWAGGPGGIGTSNSILAGISLKDYSLGDGKFSVTITDLERKCNINSADQPALEQALRLVGVDAGDSAGIAASILDWIDPDDNTHIGGTETDFYQSLEPPYFAKNQPIDDLSELLLVRGVTPEIFFGGVATNHPPAAFQRKWIGGNSAAETMGYVVGLSEIFTPISSGQININTASLTTLQMIPYVDETVASRIIELRSGPDGTSGTEDDTPAGMPGADVQSVLRSAGLADNRAVQFAAQKCTVRSTMFEVQVDAEIAGYKRQFTAIVGRDRGNPRNVQVFGFHWK
jgi:general secretion pathway protein K